MPTPVGVRMDQAVDLTAQVADPAVVHGDRAAVPAVVALVDMSATEVMAAGEATAAPVEVRAEARVVGSPDGIAITEFIIIASTSITPAVAPMAATVRAADQVVVRAVVA